MSLFVFILVLSSAVLHVFWNVFVKTSGDKVSFAWLSVLVSTVVLVPVFAASRLIAPGPLSGEIVAWAALSGLCEAAYIILLFVAYGYTDLSVVYPLSRGVAPLVVLPLSGLLLSDTVTAQHGLAIAVVIGGVTAVTLSALVSAPHRHTVAGVCLALGAGCMIACYHMVDRRAMTLAARPSPIEYLFVMHGFLLLFISAWVGISAGRRKRAFVEWRGNVKGILIVGLGSTLAYFMIMVALRHGNVAYITAGRNVGIVISTAVGAFLLKERVCRRRVLGAALIAAGVAALVALGAGHN